MDSVSIKFFASIRDVVGEEEIYINIPDHCSVSDLKGLLIERFPKLKDHFHIVLVAINRKFAFDDDILTDGSEIAIFPPVSGGKSVPSSQFTICKIVENNIDMNEILTQITKSTTGAVCIFTGVVRAITLRYRTQEIEYLVYDAYEKMAKEKMLQIADEIRKTWPKVEGIVIIQRIGKLYPGMPSAVIACSGSHRDEGVFEAARYGIDRLKEIVPIWKKEIGPGHDEWVIGNYLPGRGD